MLTILTTIEKRQFVEDSIDTVDRLHELVDVTITHLELSNSTKLLVVDDTISLSIDWNDTIPPYLIQEVELTQSNLLSVIFFGLGNHQKAFDYLSDKSLLYHDLLIATQLQFNYEIRIEQYDKIQLKHNQCIVNHYGNYQDKSPLESLITDYEDAIKTTDNYELKVYTAKHYINLLIDIHHYSKAEAIIHELYEFAISKDAKNALNVQLATVMMQQLQMPYNSERLQDILSLFQKSISFYEKRHLIVNAGLLLIDASEIANYMEDYILSKNYINTAIQYFKQEDVSEFLGEAGLRKATLLYTWSKNGQPQYYKPAINAFQDTLKVYKRDTHPQKFADIHHNLALIYSEIPVSQDEKPMWTAFCASSFKEALSFYTKETYPYEYAMISHNYATALINFPEAKLHNNLDKAMKLFESALEIRVPDKYPFERASSLINQLELYWLLHNDNNEAESKRFEEMQKNINEVKTLVSDLEMLEKIKFHENKLISLKTVL